MDVDHPAGERPEKRALQNAHETRQHHQIDARRLKFADVRGFGGLVQLRAKRAGSQITGRQPPLARPLENSRFLDVAHDEFDRRRHSTCGTRLRQRHQVRTPAGAQHSNAEWRSISHASGPFYQRTGARQAESRAPNGSPASVSSDRRRV